MSPRSAGDLLRAAGFPRVSGDEPGVRIFAADRLKFSPRERG